MPKIKRRTKLYQKKKKKSTLKTILSPLLLLYYTKVTDTGSGVKMDAVCVCVWAAFKASVGFVCALWLSVKSSIVPFKTKEPLCVQTQQAVASHSVELCWNDSSSPRIHAVTLTHTHKLSPCLYVCLPLAHKQTEPSSQGTESCTTPLSKSRHFGLPPPDRRKMERRRKGACHSGE